MLVTVFGLGLLLLLAAAALPLPRVRQSILAFAARAGQAAVLGAVAMCGTLFVRPDAAPAPVSPYAERVAGHVRPLLPDAADALPGLPWLVIAAVVVALALPVLSLVEFAARIMGQTAMLQALRKELRTLANALDRRLATLTEPPAAELTNEVAAAADALRAVAGDPPREHPARPKLVRDLI